MHARPFSPVPLILSLRQFQHLFRLILIGTAALVLAACGEATPAPSAPPVAIQAIPAADEQPAPTAIPAPVQVADTAALPQLFADSLGITLQPNSGGWESVEVLRLAPAQRWAVFTTGFRSYEPAQNHAVALFAQEESRWVELGRVELECGDYMDSRSVRQVSLEPTSIWLAVDSGTGAHSGCFDLLRWDGATLAVAVSGFNSSPGAGSVRDVDGDGQPEVVLNTADPYVFCYACGVGLFDIAILRWDGAGLRPVQLTRLPNETVADLRGANNRAVELATASLFPPALALIDESLAYAPGDEQVYWNHQLIHALAQGRLDYANSSPYPLLSWIFYGDWDAALAELNAYTPAQIFDPQMAIFQESAAAGWESTLADWIFQFSSPALDAQPDLAPAWFLQGWARFLKDPSDPAAMESVAADVAQAAQIAPGNPLYRRSLEQVSSRGISQPTPAGTATPASSPAIPAPAIPAPATLETVRFLPGATVHELPVNLSGGVARGYQLGIGGGQKLFVTRPRDVSVWLLTPGNRSISGVADAGAVRFDIPTTANYTLIFQGVQGGGGTVEILLAIPPLALPETPAPATSEEVRFAAGATSATLETTLRRGAPAGYRLGIGAGQRLWVTATLGDVDFWVLDPDGKTLSPINRTTRVGEYAIPRTGDYTLVLDGEGAAQVIVEIPPR